MKKLITDLTALLITAVVFAQVPQKMSYQAVIRDASNKLVTNHAAGIKVSILRIINIGVPIRTYYYTETQTPTTNADGLISIEIGGGTGFDSINWAKGSYYIETDIDPTGGTNYTISGTSQLLSVPYALYAKTAGGSHYIGESYGGGIVFYVYDNGQHGLIASTADQSTGIRWSGGSFTYTMAREDGVCAGKANTTIIIASQGYGDGATYAARVCGEYSVTIGSVTYGDWYLPSKYELNLMFLQKSILGGFSNNAYASSTEIDNIGVWVQNLNSGGQDGGNKSLTFYVRAIRAF
jgi:hypothetical protein